MKYSAAATGLFFFLGVSAAIPKGPTALDLYRNCQSENAPLHLACITYLRGFLDGLQAGNALAKENPPIFCPPHSGIPSDQGQLIIEKYFREHPAELQEGAGPMVMAAIMQAFTCAHGSN
jgi:Rap1a immunity proteins